MIKFHPFKRYGHNLNSAFDAVFINKFRSILTALGIIFGVAAVISMMAIGNGAQQEILEQMKMVGVNNIVITPKAELQQGSSQSSTDSESEQGQEGQKDYSPGLTMMDVESIKAIIPEIERISPEAVYTTFVIKDGERRQAQFTGVTPDFFSVFSLELEEGKMFNEQQVTNGSPVCIIGPDIKAKFFKKENPIGKKIKCGGIWLTVVGVLKSRLISEKASQNLGVSEFNNTVFAPISTMLLRYMDRSQSSGNEGDDNFMVFGDFAISSSSGQVGAQTNQLDKIIVQMKSSDKLSETAEIINRMLVRRHNGKSDFEIKVPELLLKQEQRTKDIFNIVLGAIASISLIVGGIGIMNIMLASVMERIREIGVRMAIGARKNDIIFQFVSEATIISITGGFIGIILGVILARVIMEATGILTIISGMSIFISFGVSASVGIIFGLMPARKAAQQDPVTSLRHD
jgi:putative ABC transport system permease protein